MTPAASSWLSRPGNAVAAAVALLAIEAGCTLLAIQGDLALALALHGAACAIYVALACRRGAEPTAGMAAARATAFLLPFLGPIAALGLVAILAAIRSRPDPAMNAALWHEHLFPNLAADELSEQTESINRRHQEPDPANEVESFDDVLRWGSLGEQEYVLSLISRSFRPEFAPILRAGLTADDLALRAQAAAGLSMLEARTSTHLGELRDRYRLAPPPDRADAAIELARALAEAAHSGLYDDARGREMRAEIVTVLSPLADAGQARAEIGVMLGRTLIQLGDDAGAVRRLGQVADQATDGSGALSWLLEARFRQRDFGAVEALMARHADQVDAIERKDGPLTPALRFWREAA